MSGDDQELDDFLGDVSASIHQELQPELIQPDFEAMLERASALAQTQAHHPEPKPKPKPKPEPEPDLELVTWLGEVSAHLEHDELHVAPDFLAVVARAHTLDSSVIPQSSVDEAGSYAPIIALRDVARHREGNTDPEFDTFVRDVRGHLDHAIAARNVATTPHAEPANNGRSLYKLGVAAGLFLALGLGAGVATWMGQGGGTLWSVDADTPHEAMLSPNPDPSQESEVLEDRPPTPPRKAQPRPPPPDRQPEPLSEPEPPAPTTEVHPAGPSTRRREPKRPSRRDRLLALEGEANEAWRAGKLAAAETAFRKIITIDPRGSWGESAYGELFTVQRQRKRSSVKSWRMYLKRFPNGRFADDARAGLCRRTEGDAKAACWNDYLDQMPRGSFRAQARRELDAHASADKTRSPK